MNISTSLAQTRPKDSCNKEKNPVLQQKSGFLKLEVERNKI